MTVIPAWSTSGVLPPIDPVSPIASDRSPYRTGIFDVALRFSTSATRQSILVGLLDYRQALHEISADTSRPR